MPPGRRATRPLTKNNRPGFPGRPTPTLALPGVVDAEITAIIAGASAVAGGLVVASSNYLVNRLQAADARKAELRRALIDLGDVVSRIDHRLRTEPQPGKATQAINRAMAARAPQVDHAIGLLRRRMFDPQMDQLTAAMSKTLSAALVLAPRSLLPALILLTEAMNDAETRDDEWWARWNKARTNYFLRCREAVGHHAPAPATDQEPRTPAPV